MYEKLDRIVTVDGQFATIKYVGTLPNDIWGPNVMALGVEWDQPERGKNNGTLNGISYFMTEIDGAGSFIKLSSKKIIRERYSFVEALLKQYSSSTVSESKITFGTKVAESYGFQKLNEIQSDFNNLISISLERQNIHTSFNVLERKLGIFNNLNNLTSLDLSFNLFNNLTCVWEIIDELENLEELNLNGNQFFNVDVEAVKSHKSLLTLKLASTNIKPQQVTKLILPKFPRLQDIVLSGNRYNEEDFKEVLIKHKSLLSIDLSFNKLRAIPHLSNKFNVLNSINLADNYISNITRGVVYDKIRCVDLRNNEIDNWDSVDNLYLSFPQLRELRINGNPVFENMSVEEMTINLIARFECLDSRNIDHSKGVEKLNGAFIKSDEITSAELYFISKVRYGDYNYDRSNKRWQLLVKKYDIKEPDILQSPEKKSKLSQKKLKLKLIFMFNHTSIERDFLKDNTILRLKGIISRYLNCSILKFKIYYYINETDYENKEEEYLDDNIATLENLGFQDGKKIYVTLNT